MDRVRRGDPAWAGANPITATTHYTITFLFSVWGELELEKEWMYKNTVKKRYKLTDNQIQCAMENGLVETRKVENPYYATGAAATLVRTKDVEAYLDEIRAYPKFSEKEKKCFVYQERKEMCGELEFFCPRCKQMIQALKGSTVFKVCFSGDVTVEVARKVLMIMHYRHTHTYYKERIGGENDEYYLRYQELKDHGFDFDEAWMKVEEESNINKEELKKEYNKIVVELLKEDGLL